MTIFKILGTLLLAVLCSSCHSRGEKQFNKINKIAFATGGCYGSCPIQVIEIDSSLTFTYHGVKYIKKAGYFQGKATSAFWDTLNVKFEAIGYEGLDTSYETSVDDMATEVFINYGDNKVKHIVGQESSLPDSVMAVYKWLLLSMEHFQYTPSSDSFSFETIIEKPLPIPPGIDRLKFKPPTTRQH
jgi:hypothetical protein